MWLCEDHIPLPWRTTLATRQVCHAFAIVTTMCAGSECSLGLLYPSLGSRGPCSHEPSSSCLMPAGSRRHEMTAEHPTLPIAESWIAVAATTASGARWTVEAGNGAIQAGEAMTLLLHNNASASRAGVRP